MYFVIEIIIVLIGSFSIYKGIADYGFWSRTVPGGGFMPVLMGVLLILISLLIILDKKVRVKLAFDRTGLIPVVAIIGALISNLVFGLIPSVTLMIFGWMKFVEKYSFKTSLIITVLTSTITYAIFGVWLNVPFPTGLLDIRI